MAAGSADAGGRGPYRVLSGLCPDDQCKAKLFFPAYDSSVECTDCGQRHNKDELKNLSEVTNPDVAIHNILKNILLGSSKPKKGTDSVKVSGLSNYQCKLVSPLLTQYGMDKQTGKAKLLTEMGQGAIFDCGILSDRAFLIEEKHIDTIGYGRDRTGSMNYLKETLQAMKKANNNEERILPIHADGDGHCLVHAVSRALIGRELFWHALRENLKIHLEESLVNYRNLFCDFVDINEWSDIIAECDPEFVPLNGEPLGLRNIHIFGLANVLRRPIILLDSLSGMRSSGDYSGLFLPGLVPIEKCCGRDGKLNKPICLAWSSSGRNHYIALVPVKGHPLPHIPGWLLPKVWGMPQQKITDYVEVDAEGGCVAGGDKCLQDNYILRLVTAMEHVFVDKHGVSTALVANVHQHIFKNTGIVGVKPDIVMEQTRAAVEASRLFRCLMCEAVAEWTVDEEWLQPGGELYKLAVQNHGKLEPERHYTFPLAGVVCKYDGAMDRLVADSGKCGPTQCQCCQGTQLRHVRGDGSVVYENGDKTLTPTTSSLCRCGFKHYWDGKEYDNLPERFPVRLEWNRQVIDEQVDWFQHETDISLNSNVFEVAQKLVQKHFPGVFGSERLVQKVVDIILRQTAKQTEKTGAAAEPSSSEVSMVDSPWREDESTKIILTGRQKSLHKEELTLSQTERRMRKQVEDNAPKEQSRKTNELQQQKAAGGGSPNKSSPKEQKNSSPTNAKISDPMDTADAGASSDSNAKRPHTQTSQSKQQGKKRVRVSTSDGRQIMLSLEENITYTGLQQQLFKELAIPPVQQKIKHGFPPRELMKPEALEETPVAIQDGDRLMVELLPDPEAENACPKDPDKVWPLLPQQRQSWSGFEANSRDHSAEQLLNGLTSSLQDGAADSLDTSIASLALMATLTGRDLWSYVQGMPHLFSVGGLFYEQVKRDLGLIEGKHCQLPSIPGKVFRYSSSNSRLELCLEPHGHFAVEPGIEDRVVKSSKVQNQSHLMDNIPDSVIKALQTPATGTVVNKAMKIPTPDRMPHIPFSGPGQSLQSSKENIRMPSDLDPPHHKHNNHKAKHVNESNSSHPDKIPEEVTEEMETDAERERQQYTRIGPGYSVINPQVTDEVNTTSEMIHNLASGLHSIAERAREDDDDELLTSKVEISSHVVHEEESQEMAEEADPPPDKMNLT